MAESKINRNSIINQIVSANPNPEFPADDKEQYWVLLCNCGCGAMTTVMGRTNTIINRAAEGILAFTDYEDAEAWVNEYNPGKCHPEMRSVSDMRGFAKDCRSRGMWVNRIIVNLDINSSPAHMIFQSEIKL